MDGGLHNAGAVKADYMEMELGDGSCLGLYITYNE